MSPQSPTRQLAEFAARLRFSDIPAEAVERIKLCLLDSLGCCIFGATLPWTRKVAALAMVEQAAPVATLIGMNAKSSPALAALVNGTAGHAFEFDDIHKESILHPGSLATPAVLALAEMRGQCTGEQIIAAMTAGYEVGTRVGNAATMSLFFRGFHPQGTSGVFVAAATAAHMLDLDADGLHHALGIAGSQASGLMAAQEGAMVKRFHCGRAAQSGVYSALLAERAFTGIPNVLEADYGGFLGSYSDKPNTERLTAGLGTVWETLNVGYKPHACVTSIHSALDSLAQIIRDENIASDDIVSIEVGLSKMTSVHCAWEYKAQGVAAAQMNLFYGLAVIALDGVAFAEQYREDRLRDSRILSLIERMTTYVDAEIEAGGPPLRHAARLKVVTRDGKTFEKFARHRRGSPENPLPPEEIEYKFRHVVGGLIEKEKIEFLINITKNIEKTQDIRTIIGVIS